MPRRDLCHALRADGEPCRQVRTIQSRYCAKHQPGKKRAPARGKPCPGCGERIDKRWSTHPGCGYSESSSS